MISVIVYVNNAENYINRSINSILKQSYQDFEIIFIDDASVDSSFDILKYFADNDSRIKIIKNEINNAKEFSIKSGLDIANGDYILILDGNFWLDFKALDTLIYNVEKNNLDLLLFKNMVYCDDFGFEIKEVNDFSFIEDYESKIFNSNELNQLNLITMSHLPLNKFFSKSLLDNSNFLFGEHFFYNIFSSAKRISFLNKFLINYINERNLVKKEHITHTFDILNNIIEQFLPILSLKNNSLNQFDVMLIFNLIDNVENLLIRKGLYDYFYLSFVLFKLSKIKQSFDNCNEKNKEEVYQNIRNEFGQMKLDLDVLKDIPFEYFKFYVHVLNYNNYKKFSIFNRMVKNKFEYINKQEVTIEMENFKDMGINDLQRDESIIVSLTSFPERMIDIHFCLYSLLKQTFKPDKIILWLSNEEFPNNEKDLPKSVLKLKSNGLSIEWCDDLKSYKKLIPVLKEYPNDFIITADDDIFYPEDWLERMWNTYKKYPKTIIASRLRKIKLNSNKQVEKYVRWNLSNDFQKPSFLNFPTGAGGILYFPNALSKIVFDEKLFKDLCPTGDDIWFWAMSVLNETKITGVEEPFNSLNYINISRELGLDDSFSLWNINQYGKNDVQFEKLLNHFPEILEIIIS